MWGQVESILHVGQVAFSIILNSKANENEMQTEQNAQCYKNGSNESTRAYTNAWIA